MTELTFSNLTIEGWRQFKKVSIVLHPRLTVLTGANGAGKSTLLGVFSQHFGWHKNLLATPVKKRDGSKGFFSGFLTLFKKPSETPLPDNRDRIGVLKYSDGQVSQIFIPRETGIEYGLEINSQQHISGVNIPSHRVMSRFQQIGNIPTTDIGPEQAYGNYFSEIMGRYNGHQTQFSPVYRMKESLISMATFGEGNKYVESKPELLRAYLGFIDALRLMLPESLGFQDLSIRTPDVILVTKTGEFLIDAVSGGLSSILDLTWQIYMFSLKHVNPVVVMDEPENHLHPSMQRTLMSKLLRTFPRAQFIVATHSPFIVTSEEDCNIYALRYDLNDYGQGSSEPAFAPANSVVSVKLDMKDKAGNANDVLVEVLGLETTLPEWAEKKIRDIVTRLQGVGMSPEAYREISEDLKRSGLGKALPRVLSETLGK